MELSCKYHPLESGTYYCDECDVSSCDKCVDDSKFNNVVRCFSCNRELESLGPGNIEPFWRRLQQSFKYPFETQSVMFIFILSILCSISLYLPFGVLIYLALIGSGFKYCLSCLSHTANGLMTPPDITEAYEGGFKKMLILIAMIFITSLVTYLADKFLGAAIGGVVALLVTVAFPAIIINYAISDDMFESLNPANIINLINSIGIPYGLILAFILIMSGSVAVVYQVVLMIPSSVDSIMLYMVTFYYLIVLHHLMGYMVFQYQKALGYSARLQDEVSTRRENNDVMMAKISTLIKEAEFKEATKLFNEQVRSNANDVVLNNRFFDFLLASNNLEVMAEFAPKYFNLLDKQARPDMISRNYKRLIIKFPGFELEEPALNLLIAKACFENNDAKVVIQLLRGIQKKHPKFRDLIPALELLAEALDEYPKYAAHAQACRKMIVRLRKASG